MSTPGATPKKRDEHVFHPDRTHILAAAVMTAISLLAIGHAPAKLSWVLIFPVIFVAWVLRSRTVVTDDAITTRYLLSTSRTCPWDTIKGLRFKGSRAYIDTTSGPVLLPGVSFNDIPRLSRVSGGRFPDVIEESKQAADGKMVVIYRDGRQIMMTREEYDATHARDAQANDITS